MEREPINPDRGDKSPEFDWYEKHQSEIRRDYLGEWIALSGDGVVAHDPELKNLVKYIEQLGLQESPLILPISDKPPPHFIF